MPFATLNGFPVIEANLHFPRSGLWTLDAQVDTSDGASMAGPITFKTTDGRLTLKASAIRGGSAYAVGGVYAVLGANGMGRPVVTRAYRLATRDLVVRDLLKMAGEALSTDSDPSVLSVSLPAWTLLPQTVGTALSRLLRPSGALWRSRPDGTIWIGMDPFLPLVRRDVNLSDSRPQNGDALVEFDSLDVFPGVSFAGIPVEYVSHHVGPEGIYSRLQAA